jgi:hypothetical protein
MGYSGWRFRRVSPGVFERVPANGFVSFLQCEAPLAPDSEDGDVLIVEVIVENRDRVACDAYIQGFYRYPVDASHRRRREHREQERVAWCDMVGLVDRAASDGPPTASGRFAARVAHAGYRWDPGVGDLESLAHAVNQRARRRLLGNRPLGRV